jgi:hypothetical protein
MKEFDPQSGIQQMLCSDLKPLLKRLWHIQGSDQTEWKCPNCHRVYLFHDYIDMVPRCKGDGTAFVPQSERETPPLNSSPERILYKPGDVIRMKDYPTKEGWRLWKVIAVNLGALRQESSYELKPLDRKENKPIEVPCVMLELHPGIERM